MCGLGPDSVSVDALRDAVRSPPSARSALPHADRANKEEQLRVEDSNQSIRDILFGEEDDEEDQPQFAERLSSTSDLLQRVYMKDPRTNYKVGWVMDFESPSCMICNKDFSMLRRRHHCRACGFLICSDCSSNTMPVTGLRGQQRVCDSCFHQAMSSPRPVPLTGTESLDDLLQRHGSSGNSTSAKAPGDRGGVW